MNIFTQYKYRLLVTTLSFFILSACVGGSTPEEVSPPMGSLVLAITDAPIDGASNVVVKFTGVEIKPASGESIHFDFAEKDIDLLALQGGGSEIILSNVTLEAGQYNWIRLKVIAEKNEFDSYLQEEVDGQGNPGDQISLWIPSGSETGLKLNHSFVVAVGNITDFTIDFNLRKSITDPVGQPGNLILKPSLRIVDNNKVGEIAGTVEAAMLSNIVNDTETCSDNSAVYVFEAVDLATNTIVDDIDGADDPIATAPVEMAQDGTYQYSVAFLSEGFYTIAFTCNAGDDVADEDNTDVEFLGTITVEVVADTTTEHNFIAEVTPTQ